MFAVLYRWNLHPNTDAEFVAAWSEMTESIRARWGTSGSRLHRTADGEYVAYAVWPSRARWDEARAAPSANPANLARMRACIAASSPAVLLDVVEDRLVVAAAAR